MRAYHEPHLGIGGSEQGTVINDEAVCFDNMLRLIDRSGRKPKACPACGSSVLATLLPWDFPFTEAVRRAQDACRAAYQRAPPSTGSAPAWRCLDCGAQIAPDLGRKE